MHWTDHYRRQIADITNAGDATEISYRTPIQELLQAASAEFQIKTNVLQEPTRTKNIGAPDFRITQKSGGVIGYVECKKPGDNLQKLTTKNQLEKYRALSGNILLTDSWHWLLLRDGKKIGAVVLTEKQNKETQTAFINLVRIFMEAEPEKIGDAKRLATALARRCAILHDGLKSHAQDEPAKSSLHGLLAAFQTALDTGLGFDKFADAFAQTLVYSLLLAKLKAPPGVTLDLYNINRHIPGNFAVIREITAFVQGLDDADYQDIRWAVDDILAAINSMDAVAVGESMSYRNGGTGFDDDDDPYVYFYENFLAAYDAKQRERRGVYYTPPAVVKFIVRAVDDLLRDDFGLKDGLAETNTVTALDFAAGTGTFMLEMFRTVLNDKPPSRRDMLTHSHLLKNFYGFELLMAPYAIAHLKLSQFLADNEVPLNTGERINILLTNTLEQISKQVALPMMPKLAQEANRAQAIKESPVLVITGNPPYSGVSQNKGAWIGGLIETYKLVDGEPLGERNPKWLQDDYVKFIRFAQWKMEQVERGVVAIITNHGFLDNPTFRGMRQSLSATFDALYFLDLHGNAKKKETAPDGGRDENIFDIQQGVAVSILIKNPKTKNKGVFHADLWGSRTDKYAACMEHSLKTVKWRPVKPMRPFYLFVPRKESANRAYQKLIPVREIFCVQGAGMTTAHDEFVIDIERDDLLRRFIDFQASENNAAMLHEKFNVAKKKGWDIMRGKRALANEKDLNKFIQTVAYRPFDNRHIFYETNLVWRTVEQVMRHMSAKENLGLVTVRQVKAGRTWQHCLVTDNLIESTFVSNKTSEIAYLFPLYRYDNGMGEISRVENLHPKFRKWIDDRYGEKYTPENILGCIYAILNSPDYRKRYADFLRTDFPRISFPKDNAEFTRLAAIGNDLIAAHLLRKGFTTRLAQYAGDGTTHEVEKIRYDEKTSRLYFNKDQYFENFPPQVFNFQIGGYQPLDKYLKSRKNRMLTSPEITTIQKAANAIAFTIEKIKEIDP